MTPWTSWTSWTCWTRRTGPRAPILGRMPTRVRESLSTVVLLVVACGAGAAAVTGARQSTTLTRVAVRNFAATTPSDPAVMQQLGIPSGTASEVIEWSLVLREDPITAAPISYELSYAYGMTQRNLPGLARDAMRVQRQGTWTRTKGTKSRPTAIIELSSGLTLAEIEPRLLHILNPDRSLMVGNGGWSYSLNRTDAGEAAVPASLSYGAPDMPYPISPVSAGPSVFGVFEGRTPCQRIARELQAAVERTCVKLKWRVTLYQNPGTHGPTSYKVEGSLFSGGAREGRWTATPDATGRAAGTLYRLESGGRSPALVLLKGDDNVLFFLERSMRLLVGRSDFSYTLDRRPQASAPHQ
jgi:hypothetical protein